MKAALTSYFLANAGLTAAVGSNLNWNERPQGAALPAINLSRVSTGIAYHHAGATDLERARVQADCWGRTALECETSAKALRAAVETMHEARGDTMLERGFIENMIDTDPEDLGGGVTVHRIIVEFFVWHRRT